MADFGTEFNIQSFNIDPIILVDEVSSDEIYIGASNNGKNADKLSWRIKKIWKDGTVWKFEFPNGDQSYKYAWGLRSGYTYE